MHWYECTLNECIIHEETKHQTGWYPTKLPTTGVWSYEGYAQLCYDLDCDRHDNNDRHEQLEWTSCYRNNSEELGCDFHFYQKHAVSTDSRAFSHSQLQDTECNDEHCRIHAKELSLGIDAPKRQESAKEKDQQRAKNNAGWQKLEELYLAGKLRKTKN
jgi:hypothetical protein